MRLHYFLHFQVQLDSLLKKDIWSINMCCSVAGDPYLCFTTVRWIYNQFKTATLSPINSLTKPKYFRGIFINVFT